MVWRQEISHTEKVLISKLVCPLCGPIIMPWKHIEQNVGLLMYFVHLTVFVRFLKDFFHKYFFIGTVFIRFFSCELYQLIFFVIGTFLLWTDFMRVATVRTFFT